MTYPQASTRLSRLGQLAGGEDGPVFVGISIGIVGGVCLLLGLSLVLGSLLLGGANKSLGTEPGDVPVIASDLADEPGTSIATDAATGDPIAIGLHAYSIDESSGRRPGLRLLLIGLLGRGPRF